MGWKVLRRAVLFTVLLVLYLASTVPVGLFLYSLKTDSGVNIFCRGRIPRLHALFGQIVSVRSAAPPVAADGNQRASNSARCFPSHPPHAPTFCSGARMLSSLTSGTS